VSKLVLFNKPFQVLSQFKSIDGKSSLADFLASEDIANCYPAGRLDYDSEGLLLLTDDGALQHRISHPDKKLKKYYWVQVEGCPQDKDLEVLRNGISLKDGKCKPAQVKIIKQPQIWERNPSIRKRKNDETTWLEIIIREGKNRQVRRMTAAIGFPCLRLIRFRIGSWSLKDLLPGNYQVEKVHLPKS
jgi:23S rRNA pseudouridine2457 synthase